jgi:amino acid transporter
MSTEKDVYDKSPPSTPLHDDTHLKDPEETLHRDLKARQISMIALGGAVGTGYVWFPPENSKFEIRG